MEKQIALKYGNEEMMLKIEEKNILQVIESNPIAFEKTESEISFIVGSSSLTES